MDSVGKLVGEEEKEEGEGEMDPLLGTKPKLKPPAIGGLAKKERRQRGSSRRRVQWNDRNGNKLVEVLEFQRRYFFLLPVYSDTSDSEDEYADSCICTIM